MAKYVGKIFRVNNKILRIKGSGSHFVHVKWYNPFTHKFRCHIITSLEEKKVLTRDKRNNLHIMSYHKENENTYCIFNRKKYEDLRSGKITPIPVSCANGLTVWSGYQDRRNLHIATLRGNEVPHIKIKSRK